ncbi:MAG: UGSC family (seleno)protein [Dehalococcoidales bacterium]
MKKNGSKITVLDPIGQPSGIFGSRLDPDSMPWAIHDPTNQPRDTAEKLGALKMAPRLDKLEGKTVFLVNTGFAGGKEFIEELHDWFTANRPGIKTEVRNKKTSMFTDEPELWVEIKQKGDAAILGVGG